VPADRPGIVDRTGCTKPAVIKWRRRARKLAVSHDSIARVWRRYRSAWYPGTRTETSEVPLEGRRGLPRHRAARSAGQLRDPQAQRRTKMARPGGQSADRPALHPDHPQSFAWTKDTDEILDSIQRVKAKTAALTATNATC
jgi:hypothetical protein